MSSETRTFRPHPNLLMDVIRRQAGTLSKAILEAVMNSVDAGAGVCRITVQRDHVTIEDDGRGFKDRREVEQFFEVFGTPHDEGDAVYGQFRMGRGQLFAFGSNLWMSNKFRMMVDVMRKGLDYEFDEMDAAVKGCRVDITLYHPLSNVAIRETLEEVKRFVAHVSIPVSINGVVASKPPAEQKWDHDEEWGWLRFTQGGSFKVYNLGVFVREFHSGYFGVGGVFVSKKQLRVNFARSDIMSDCGVWRKAKDIIQRKAMEGMKNKPVLDDAGRERVAREILDRTEEGQRGFYECKVITDVQGRHHTIPRAFRSAVITVAPDHDRTGDVIMQGGRAFVVAESTLDRFGVRSLKELVSSLLEAGYQRYSLTAKIEEYAKLAAETSSDHVLIPKAKWKPSEAVWIDIAASMIYKICHLTGVDFRFPVVGKAEGCLAWTDGSTYIALDRDMLGGLKHHDMADLCSAARVLLHELCHEEEDTERDTHGHEFYRTFHERSSVIGQVVSSAFNSAAKAMERQAGKLNKKSARMMDRIEAAKKAEQKMALAMLVNGAASEAVSRNNR